MYKCLNLFLLCLLLQNTSAQNIECLAFYNLENLFNTVDDENRDEEYLPENGWTEERYASKLDRMAEVIDQVGRDYGVDGPSFFGVSEIENKGVLEDLVAHPTLAPHEYQILHFNSPDKRGIDVAALYKKDRFTPINVKAYPLMIYGRDGDRKFTRDILLVQGLLNGEMIYVTVNHWPSRRGGQKVSGPYRVAAGEKNRMIYDSLRQINPDVNFIVMGDLNDNPNNKSIKTALNAKKRLNANSDALYNPFCRHYSKGMGSNAWDDTWSNFDQIILSSSFAEGTSGWNYRSAKIFKKNFMLQKTGRYKGYPLRTQAGGQYLGGYSDHFPVLVYLER